MGERYLVTAISGKIGQSVIHCLAKEGFEKNLVGCDMILPDSGYTEVDEFFIVPSFKDEENYLYTILEQCNKRNITHILPITEDEIKLFDKYRVLFEQAKIKVMIQNPSLLQVVLSKHNTVKAIRSIGLNCFDVESQEHTCISGDEYVAGVFSNGKETKTIVFRRSFGFDRMVKLEERVEDEKINAIVNKIADAFQLRGSINIRIYKQEREYYIFDINPKISSALEFRYSMGYKEIKWWLDLLNNKNGKILYEPENLPIIRVKTLGERIFGSNLQLEKKYKRYIGREYKESDSDGVLILSNNHYAVMLYEWLLEYGEKTILYSEKLTEQLIQQWKPKWIISYGYRYIIKDEIIRLVKGKIINMHISYLPWNRGANQNVWSFIDNTPKGVTIHYIDSGLDTGDILVQKQVWFDEAEETFESTYDALNDLMISILRENWEKIKKGELTVTKQKQNEGSYHSQRDFEKYLNGRVISWNENIQDFKRKMVTI